MAEKQEVLAKLLDVLDGQKAAFERSLESAVRQRITQTSRTDCIGIIERSQSYGLLTALAGPLLAIVFSNEEELEKIEVINDNEKGFHSQRVYNWKHPINWTERFIVMNRHKGPGQPKLKDSPWFLEPVLSSVVLDEINKTWDEFFQSRHEDIREALFGMIQVDLVVREQLARHIADAVGKAGKPLAKPMRKGMIHMLTNHVTVNIATQTTHAVSGQLGHAIQQAATHGALGALTTAVGHTLGAVLKSMVVKYGHVAGLKVLVGGAVKKKIIAFICANVLTFLGAHLTAGATAAIILPIVMAFAAKGIYDLPKKMAAKVSPDITRSVMGDFRDTNKSMFEQIFQEAVVKNLKQIGKDLVKEIGMVKKLHEATEEHIEQCKEKGILFIEEEEEKIKEDDDCRVM